MQNHVLSLVGVYFPAEFRAYIIENDFWKLFVYINIRQSPTHSTDSQLSKYNM